MGIIGERGVVGIEAGAGWGDWLHGSIILHSAVRGKGAGRLRASVGDGFARCPRLSRHTKIGAAEYILPLLSAQSEDVSGVRFAALGDQAEEAKAAEGEGGKCARLWSGDTVYRKD